MRRRNFMLSLASVGTAWPFRSHAQQHQQRALPRIGLLLPGTPAAAGPARNSIVRGLAERGYVDGKTITIEHRHAEGQLERLPGLARELASIPVDVIVSVAASATVAARDATATIPIVMVHAGDPIGHGLIDSLARPGRNVTGTTSNVPDIIGKSVALLHELVPAARHLALVVVPSNSGAALTVREAQLAATNLGIELTVVGVERADDLDGAFATIERAASDMLLVSGEPMLFANRARVLAFAARTRLPAMYTIAEFVRDGGLLGYSPIFGAHHQLAADYVDKILKGAKPSELPVAQSTQFELVLNLKTSKALGLTISPTLLARADEVIE